MILRILHSTLPLIFFALAASAPAQTARETIASAALEGSVAKKRQLLDSLAGKGDPAIAGLFDAWRQDQLFIATAEDGAAVAVQLTGEPDADEKLNAISIATGEPLLDASGQPARFARSELKPVEHNALLRRSMKGVLDLVDLSSEDPDRRLKAVQTIGYSQDASKLPPLEKRLSVENNGRVRNALLEGIALIQLKDPSDETRLHALDTLRELATLGSFDSIRNARAEAETAGKAELAAAAEKAMRAVNTHRATVNLFGTMFRGLSLGSILLVVALGLAITFGLMGVINMAHGEMIAVGAYATYVTQCFFGSGVTLPFFGRSLPIPGMNLEGWGYNAYFVCALPVSFLAAALVGIGLERGIIRFLYRRPLESLLATWGVSLVLQQIFRLMFGANNVQVSSPSYLSGNWTINDIIFGWNRVFVILFAIMIVFGVWLALNRTPLGLLIRSVMQNRTMAACMGVRIERVNMLTFGLGSGLAGLAGAFLSQIGNVGPSLGQSYIVDSFMVVVVGGVGNIAGTVISAFGIGGVDQILQQYLPDWAPGLAGFPMIGSFLQNLAQDSAVFGKILVLVFIILFLQWRPAGIFVTRSRNLEG